MTDFPEIAGVRKITAEGAPRKIYTVECLACPGECSRDDSPGPAAEWLTRHQARHPEHTQFAWNERTFWEVEPRDHGPGEGKTGS